MGQADYYASGQFNCICDRCGFKMKSSQTRLEWTGLRVCGKCWEPRHPQDFVRGRRDNQMVPQPRPDPDAPLLAATDVTTSTFESVTNTGGTSSASQETFLAVGDVTEDDL